MLVLLFFTAGEIQSQNQALQISSCGKMVTSKLLSKCSGPFLSSHHYFSVQLLILAAIIEEFNPTRLILNQSTSGRMQFKCAWKWHKQCVFLRCKCSQRSTSQEVRRELRSKSAPSSRLRPAALATFRSPRPLQSHQRLLHALLRVGQIHVGEVHLEGLQETQGEANGSHPSHTEGQLQRPCSKLTSFSFLSTAGVCFLMLLPV